MPILIEVKHSPWQETMAYHPKDGKSGYIIESVVGIKKERYLVSSPSSDHVVSAPPKKFCGRIWDLTTSISSANPVLYYPVCCCYIDSHPPYPIFYNPPM